MIPRILLALLIALAVALAGCTADESDEENTDEEAGDEQDSGGGVYARAPPPDRSASFEPAPNGPTGEDVHSMTS